MITLALRKLVLKNKRLYYADSSLIKLLSSISGYDIGASLSNKIINKSILVGSQLASAKSNQSLTYDKNSGHKTTNNKQVHFADVVPPGSNAKINSKNKKNKQNGSRTTIPSSKKQQTKQVNTPQLSELDKQNTTPLGTIPSLDELDSSISIGVFNPKSNQTQPKQRGPSMKKNERKRHNSDRTDHSIYSSERLFSMIAASSLSKDEIEIAIETLLDKQESGESDWRQAKGDPLHKLRSQLHDVETALVSETKKHEQTRSRLNELNLELQAERTSRQSIHEESSKLKLELASANLALEETADNLRRQCSIRDEMKEEHRQMVETLERENANLKSLLAGQTEREENLSSLQRELEERRSLVQQYELSNANLSNRLQDLEAKLSATEIQLDIHRSNRQQEEYETCARINELESDRMALERALKDQAARFKEVSEAKNLMENRLKELQIVNCKQDDMLKRLQDEREVKELSMSRTLCEMEAELRELHGKLSAKVASNDESLRQELIHFEHELSNAGQRERNLTARIEQLKDGLAELFPELRSSESNGRQEDWIHKYLAALKLLGATVEELRRRAHQGGADNSTFRDGERSDKSTLTPTRFTRRYMYSRPGTPSSGRSSRASNNDDGMQDKRLMETKLLEVSLVQGIDHSP